MEKCRRILFAILLAVVCVSAGAFEYRVVLKSDTVLSDNLECSIYDIADSFMVFNDSIKNGTVDISGVANMSFPATLIVSNNNPDSLAYHSFHLIMEPGTITVDMDRDIVEGGELNHKYNDYVRRVKEGSERSNSDMKDVMMEVYAGNLNNGLGKMVLIDFGNYCSPKEWKEAVKCLDEESRSLEAIRSLTDRMERLSSSWVGQPFKDVSGRSADGTLVNLSDFVGKGKIVVADIWASWCKGCIVEAKEHIIPLYEQLKDSPDVEFVGIALDDVSKAVGKHGFEWSQIMDCKKVMGEYTVYALPEVIMFGRDGTILHRHLRGGEIGEHLKVALENKEE